MGKQKEPSTRITETDMRLALFLLRSGGGLYDREICRRLKIHRSTYIRSLKRLIEADVLAASPAKRGCVPALRTFTVNETSPVLAFVKFLYSEQVAS